MAESSLSLTYAEMASIVARTGLGIRGSSTDWTTQETTDINRVVDKGYSDFQMHTIGGSLKSSLQSTLRLLIQPGQSF